MQSVVRTQLKDAQDARINGIAPGNANSSNGRVTNPFVTSYLAIDRKMTRRRKKSKLYKKRRCHSQRH